MTGAALVPSEFSDRSETRCQHDNAADFIYPGALNRACQFSLSHIKLKSKVRPIGLINAADEMLVLLTRHQRFRNVIVTLQILNSLLS